MKFKFSRSLARIIIFSKEAGEMSSHCSSILNFETENLINVDEKWFLRVILFENSMNLEYGVNVENEMYSR